LGVFGDCLDLVVCEYMGVLLLGGRHNGNGLFQLGKLVGRWGGEHGQFAGAVNVLELVADHPAVFAVGELGDFSKVLVY
jgi:hypothetical protein